DPQRSGLSRGREAGGRHGARTDSPQERGAEPSRPALRDQLLTIHTMMAARHCRALASPVLLALLAACASCPEPPPGGPTRPTVYIPGILRPPAGEVLQRTLMAEGVQIYECRAKAGDAAARPQWALVAPEATLTDNKGTPVGKHYAGPTWEAND